MQQLVELSLRLPFCDRAAGDERVYDRELPHRHRWLQRRTKLLVKPVGGDGSSAEWLDPRWAELDHGCVGSWHA